jgi:hypothetical protein
MRTLVWAEIEAQAADRAPGYLDAISAAGKREGQLLRIEDADFARIRADFPGPSGPSLGALTANFAGAILRWQRAGFPVVSREVFQARMQACNACPNWGTDGVIAKCSVCGCTALKLWAGSERCPESKWPDSKPS